MFAEPLVKGSIWMLPGLLGAKGIACKISMFKAAAVWVWQLKAVFE